MSAIQKIDVRIDFLGGDLGGRSKIIEALIKQYQNTIEPHYFESSYSQVFIQEIIRQVFNASFSDTNGLTLTFNRIDNYLLFASSFSITVDSEKSWSNNHAWSLDLFISKLREIFPEEKGVQVVYNKTMFPVSTKRWPKLSVNNSLLGLVVGAGITLGIFDDEIIGRREHPTERYLPATEIIYQPPKPSYSLANADFRQHLKQELEWIQPDIDTASKEAIDHMIRTLNNWKNK